MIVKKILESLKKRKSEYIYNFFILFINDFKRRIKILGTRTGTQKLQIGISKKHFSAKRISKRITIASYLCIT